MLAAIFCQNMGIKEVVMGGDTLQMVNNLSKTTNDWSQGGLMIEDAKNILNCFASWFANHIKRYANKVAHCLARNALKLHENLYDLEEISTCIQSTIFREMMKVFF